MSHDRIAYRWVEPSICEITVPTAQMSDLIIELFTMNRNIVYIGSADEEYFDAATGKPLMVNLQISLEGLDRDMLDEFMQHKVFAATTKS